MRNKLICITIVALILLVQKDSFAYADVVVEDVEETSRGKFANQEQAAAGSGKKGKKLTQEEKLEKRRQKQEKNKKLESCLVMTRSYYQKHEKQFNDYLSSHAATSYNGDDVKMKKQAQVNRNMLLSKINANMLIKCDEAISKEQIEELQKFKDDSYHFDSSKAGFSKLVEVRFKNYDVAPQVNPKIEFTNPENAMLSMIEDINDKLNKDSQTKSGRNALNIAFFDVSQMSAISQVIYLLLMLGGISGLIYYFYQLLVEKPQQMEAEKLRLREERRKKKTK